MSNTTDRVMNAKLPETIKLGVEAIAKAMGVASVELWSIFVRQYVVKGVTEVFTASVLIGAGIFLAYHIKWWAVVPLTVALPFCYGAILLLGNPKYYAIQDITKKIKELK